jgi:FkbM family methyltransferase
MPCEKSNDEAIERLINIERKINVLLEAQVSADNFSGHPDQSFGHVSYSQNGEDFIILNAFHFIGNPRPSYLDVGAHHPTNISNTALLYKRGSRGINVEANPNLIAAFTEQRPEDTTVNVGVGPQRGKQNFYCIDKWSGRNTFDRQIAEEFVRQHPKFRINEIMEIEMITLNDLVDNTAGGVFPDLLNLDVEGLEYEILKSVDFSRGKPSLICVEAVNGSDRDRSVKLVELLEWRGYKPYAKTIGNIIFVTDEVERQLWAAS